VNTYQPIWTPDDFRKFKLEIDKHAHVHWREPLAAVIDIRTRERLA
jgi:hypothetical protein